MDDALRTLRVMFVAVCALVAVIGVVAVAAAGSSSTPAHTVRPITLQAPPLPKLAAAPGASACILVSRPVVVELNDVRTPESVEHVKDAVRAGEPRRLHIDRVDADAHRVASLKGVATAPGKDRDEYPPALSAEGGAGADVRLITSGDNRSAGSTMGAQLAPFCESQAFIIEEGLP